jgi:hypothetical protein
MTRQQTRGRRMALPPPERVARGIRARLNITALLGVLLPALTVGALSLVRPADLPDTTYPPRQTGLNLAVLTCPGALTDRRAVAVASATGAAGEVEIRATGGASPTTVEIDADRPADADISTRPVMVTGVDAMAPGLLAARQDDGPASVSCLGPQPDQWFTGLGAAARHSSVLELVNPDPGPAVADITVIGARGPVDAPSLRGITVPGGRGLRLDLAREIPLRGELAARVVVSRGRLGVYAADAFDQLGRGDAGVDWLAAQEPGATQTLLGLPTGTGSRSVVIANDGDDEARVVVRVVTKDSAFRPQGLEDVRVPPHAVKRVPLSAILGAAVKDGAVGVSLEATHPVTATLRSFVDGDVSHAVPVAAVTEATQAILPAGRATVLLTSDSVGSAEVSVRADDGDTWTRKVDLAPGRTVLVRLPKGASLVEVTPTGTAVRGVVVVQDDGAAVVGLHELVRTGLVPHVRPALP